MSWTWWARWTTTGAHALFGCFGLCACVYGGWIGEELDLVGALDGSFASTFPLTHAHSLSTYTLNTHRFGSNHMYMVVGFEVVACSISRKAGDSIESLQCPGEENDVQPQVGVGVLGEYMLGGMGDLVAGEHRSQRAVVLNHSFWMHATAKHPTTVGGELEQSDTHL